MASGNNNFKKIQSFSTPNAFTPSFIAQSSNGVDGIKGDKGDKGDNGVDGVTELTV